MCSMILNRSASCATAPLLLLLLQTPPPKDKHQNWMCPIIPPIAGIQYLPRPADRSCHLLPAFSPLPSSLSLSLSLLDVVATVDIQPSGIINPIAYLEGESDEEDWLPASEADNAERRARARARVIVRDSETESVILAVNVNGVCNETRLIRSSLPFSLSPLPRPDDSLLASLLRMVRGSFFLRMCVCV